MKKIYYFLLAITCFASCKPLSKTFDDIAATPVATGTAITLGTSDFKMLPTSVYASSGSYFKNYTDANIYVPTILNSRYPNAVNKTSVNVTFNTSASYSSVPVPDSTYSRVAFTLGAADYIFPGNTTASLTSAAVINYLNFRYPTPSPYQMVVLTYNYLEAGISPPTGNTATDTFIYINYSWTKVYTISPDQYTSIGRGSNWILSTDITNLVSYFNSFLKADPTIVATAKAGTTILVSYRYTTTYQKILALTFDGTNWVARATLPYLRLGGSWIPDPSITITEPIGVNADYAWLKTTTIGSDAARSNLASFGDFDIRVGPTTAWSPADVTAALAAILAHRISTPVQKVDYKIIYSYYNGSVSSTSMTFQWNGTAFVISQ